MVDKFLLLGVIFFLQGATGVPEESVTGKDFPLVFPLLTVTAEFNLLFQPRTKDIISQGEGTFEDSRIVSKQAIDSMEDAPLHKSSKWIPSGETTLNIFLLFFLYHLKRSRRQRQVQWLKKRISADLHDEFGSRLTNIQFLSAVSGKGEHSDLEWQSHMERIGVEASSLTESLNEIVWNLNRKDENLEELVAKMRRYTHETLESFGFRCTIDIRSDFQGKKMRMPKRSLLFMVYKEMLNNIVKHARATEVRILISEKSSSFHLVIEDNGIGFDPFKRSERNGIKNAIERVQRVNGQIDIVSNFNYGSKIEILIPFDNKGVKILISKPSFKRLKFINTIETVTKP